MEIKEIDFTSSEALKPNEWKSLEIISREFDRGSTESCLDRGSSTLAVVLGGRSGLEERYMGNIDLTYHRVKGGGNRMTYLRRLSIMTE